MIQIWAPVLTALAIAPTLPGMTFRPAVSVSDVLGGFEMCRAVVTGGGIDPGALKKKHWSPVEISADDGAGVSTQEQSWSPPNTIMMLFLKTEPAQATCHVAAQVRDQTVVAKALSKLPLWIKPTSDARRMEGDDGGQHIAVSVTDSKDYPSINIWVTRQLEPK